MDQLPSILIVDDDVVDRMSVLRALSQAELRIVEAGSAAEAFEQLAHSRFDCIVLDQRLPDRTGLSVLQAIRASGVDSAVVMLTGHGDEELASELMRAGATDYLPKSAASPSLLATRLERALRTRSAELAVRRTARQQAVLAQAALATHSQLDESTVPGILAEIACSLLQARRAEVTFVGAGQLALSPEAAALPSGPTRLSAEEFQSPDRRALRAASALVPETEWFGAPLLDRGRRPIGLLQAIDRAEPGFVQSDLSMFGQLANLGALALDNARLFREAQDALRARNDILAIVSHDLRNPLNVVSMSGQLLRTMLPASSSGARVHTVLERIERAALQMTKLVNDLLDASRIDAGMLKVETREEDARALVDEAVEAFEPLAQEKSVRLLAPEDGLSRKVTADRARVLQVFSNLLGNAVKFTPAGHSIRLGLREATGSVEFSVADEGPGISPEHLPHLFERFWQSRATGRSGAGLGLYIAKGIVDAHGGQFTVDSEQGRGSTFRFSLPAIAPLSPARDPGFS